MTDSFTRLLVPLGIAFSGIILHLIFLGGFETHQWYKYILLFVCLFVISYWLINVFVVSNIRRKMRPIFNMIMDNGNGEDEYSPLQDKYWRGLEKNAMEAIHKSKDELSLLKTLEIYRKEYIGHVSHELKTPIYAIQGYLNILLDEQAGKDNTDTKFLQKALRNTQRLQRIIEDLERISRYESVEHALNYSFFGIEFVIREVYEMLEDFAKDNEIKLDFKKGADRDMEVYADRNQIYQVLMNLVDNAIKYGKKGGVVLASIYDMEEYVLIEISDNGVGIPENHVKHIFDRFYRVDPSRSRDIGGTGLGLSIVKHIIEAHGQKIFVRSTEGQGTTIGFTLSKYKK